MKAGIVSTITLLFLVSSPLAAEERPSPTPEAALARLQEGHARFLADRPAARHTSAKERVKLATQQHPFAVVLTCADSRVAPELIFDQGLGDLFVLRVAGNVTEPGVVGSIEYAIEHLQCPLIVVLGHESCGAVTAAMKLDDLHGNLGALVEQVRLGGTTAGGDVTDLRAALDAAVRHNTRHHAGELVYKSTMIRDAVGAGRVRIFAGVYSLSSGDVDWIDPLQSELSRR
jgi:carbonic anhydrase